MKKCKPFHYPRIEGIKQKLEVLTCKLCGKKLKNWYKISGTKDYFCCLKHLEEWELKNKSHMNLNS